MSHVPPPAPAPGPAFVSLPVPIRAVVLEVVAQFAPDELQYLQGVSLADDASVLRSLHRGGNADKQLGYGLNEVEVVVVAAVWLVLNQASQRVANTFIDRIVIGCKLLFRKLLRRPAVATVVPPLTRAQLDSVWRLIQEELPPREPGDRRPLDVANAVVARLATGTVPPSGVVPADHSNGGTPAVRPNDAAPAVTSNPPPEPAPASDVDPIG